MKYILLLTTILISIHLSAQQKAILDQVEDIEKAASKEFEKAMLAPEGSLFLFAKEHSIEGTYTFKISVGDKNKVTSVFVLNREGGDIPMQNNIKDAVKDFKFDSFKVQKGKHYNIKYTFKF